MTKKIAALALARRPREEEFMSTRTAWELYAAANAAVEAVQSCVDRLKRKVQGLRPYRSPAQQFERAARLVESMDIEDSGHGRR